MTMLKIWVVVGPDTPRFRRQLDCLSSSRSQPSIVEVPAVLSSAVEEGTAADLFSLRSREIEILTLVARGFSNKRIARALGLAPSTVSNNVSHLLAKLGAHNRAELAMLAAMSGIVDDANPDAH